MKKIIFAFIVILVLASATTPARLLSIIASNQGIQATTNGLKIETTSQGTANGLRKDPGAIPPVDPSKCKTGEVMTPSGCWNSCADPRFQKCPDVFSAIFNPDFCAFTREGKYVSETYECEACKRKEAFAVRKGACSCEFVKCGSGEICRNGQCDRPTASKPKGLKFNNTYKPNFTHDSDLLIRLDADGKAKILNGCNNLAGNYKAF
jgi:hypothetical protein